MVFSQAANGYTMKTNLKQDFFKVVQETLNLPAISALVHSQCFHRRPFFKEKQSRAWLYSIYLFTINNNYSHNFSSFDIWIKLVKPNKCIFFTLGFLLYHNSASVLINSIASLGLTSTQQINSCRHSFRSQIPWKITVRHYSYSLLYNTPIQSLCITVQLRSIPRCIF